MGEAEELLRRILENGHLVGRDGAGRNVLQLALDDADMDELMAFGADAAEREMVGTTSRTRCASPRLLVWGPPPKL